MTRSIYILICGCLLAACQDADINVDSRMQEIVDKHYGIPATTQIILTAESGEKQSIQENIPFRDGQASGIRIVVQPNVVKQTIDGIGTSFTESSAFVLAHLEPAERRAVMNKIYSDSGANFSLARTHIGATDFSVEGKYSYADVPGDAKLEHFSYCAGHGRFPG